MNRRFWAPGTAVALALLLLAGTPVTYADLPPTRQPLRVPYDSDPEVPNEALLLPSGPVRTETADRVGEPSALRPTRPSSAALKPVRPGRLAFEAQRAAAWFFARVRGGWLR